MIMNNEERDQLIREIARQVGEMHADLKLNISKTSDLSKSVYGNGQPGVLSRVQAVEQRQQECPARRAMIEGQSVMSRQGWLSLLVSVIAAGLAAAAIVMT